MTQIPADRLKNRSVVSSLVLHRRLVWEFARRNLETQHKGSLAGSAWMIFGPLLIFSVYAFVFMEVFTSSYTIGGTETRLEFALALFVSLQVANFVIEVFQATPLAVVQQGNYVKKLIFPLEVLPTSLVVAACVRCAVATALVVALKIVFGGVGLALIWLPVILLSAFVASTGIGLGLAAIGVFLRDIVPIVQSLSVVLMFVSGVFYSSSSLPATFGFLRFNPLLVAVESAREVVVWNNSPSIVSLQLLIIPSVIMFFAGASLFRMLRPAFADVL
jgi:lipopolysaccharide transport system permease protein